MSKTKTSLQTNYEQLKSITQAIEADYDKFNEKKVKASGQRMRNGLLNIKKLCDTLRKEIKQEMDDIPVKHRTNSPERKEEYKVITTKKDEVKEEKKDEVKEEKKDEVKEEIPPPPKLVRQNGEENNKTKKPKKPKKKTKSK